jgi:hypothetical protein
VSMKENMWWKKKEGMWWERSAILVVNEAMQQHRSATSTRAAVGTCVIERGEKSVRLEGRINGGDGGAVGCQCAEDS